jgi:DNA polymerase I-like protein with 3'-5' exonuclease and polymerase domains
MYPKKAGATLNISKDEGAVVIRTIEKELPATFAMVKQASIDAERQGYVILNNRTNSRAWFPNLIRQIKGEISMDTHFMDISKDKSDARNIRIQGTQADFVKESTVVMWKYFRKHKIDAKFLSWVHDEEVVRNPIELDGHSDKWKELNSKNPIQLPSFHTKGKYYNNIVEVEKEIMEVVANRYLHNVVISAEVSVEPYWTKE